MGLGEAPFTHILTVLFLEGTLLLEKSSIDLAVRPTALMLVGPLTVLL